MNERTRSFLTAAIRHRATAEFLRQSSTDDPAVREWVVIAAFYAAVHYINAYLWERLRLEPSNHSERSDMVELFSELRPVVAQYRYLRDSAYSARYDPDWRMSEARVHEPVDDLETIASAVVAALNRP